MAQTLYSRIRTHGTTGYGRSPRNPEFLNSLIPAKNSLFFEIFSLLIFAGNLPRSGCGTGVFRSEIASKSVEIAKFPVIFPVSRELQVETGSYLTAHTTIQS
jgi:hypothetical protein